MARYTCTWCDGKPVTEPGFVCMSCLGVGYYETTDIGSDKTIGDFFKYSVKYYEEHKDHMRYGQAVFNALDTVRPELGDIIRGTENDPYYVDENVGAFWTFVTLNWDKKEE